MSPYQILQISETATPAEIKSAYRKMVKQYHPDVNSDPNASALFRQVQDAFDQINGKSYMARPEPRARTWSAVGNGLKLYEFVNISTTNVTIHTGYREIPENSTVFLMWGGTEYRVHLGRARMTPFSLKINTPPIMLTIKE